MSSVVPSVANDEDDDDDVGSSMIDYKLEKVSKEINFKIDNLQIDLDKFKK